ncbi:MAG TPA: HEAT repeat domain-containing protein, partial [Planctomycetota bacterium]|nr:HEAT repeat domain-containing protein [Planctomycetota bacterium]
MKTLILCAFALLSLSFCGYSAEPEKDGDKPSDAAQPDAWANGQRPKYPFKVFDASDEGQTAIKKFKLDRDLKCELFAAEPMVANIVAFTVDNKGRFYVAETFRVGEGVIDNRQHMDWLEEDLNSRSVEDRAAFQKRHLGANVIKEMGWASERIKIVEDRAGKGKADFSQVFADGFDTILDGVGAGVLVRKGTVYYTDIPNLWMLKDEKGAGYATTRKSLAYGFGVRNAFMGHDLHGLRMGPDGRIYFSIGDRAARVKTAEGRLIDNPDSGAVFRCNPDGSGLELYCTGLRNPQCLSFDRYGNLFTGDNNADSGDKARWEYIVEGGDYGWRIGWQYMRSPALGSFNTEKMWHEQEPDQPRFILPPVGLIAAGPSGNLYYPGTGMPDRYSEHFFLCDFTGGITAKVHSFRVQPKGASFELVDRAVLIEGCLCTDLAWGVNGGIYVSDWVEGWTKTGKGRIYRVYEDKSAADPLVGEVKKLLAEGFDQRGVDELIGLLNHKDLRIRQEAQFALADKAIAGDDAPIKALDAVLANKDSAQPSKLHAMWALEMIARKKPQAIEALIPLLEDNDTAIKGQAAKMLGERRCEKAADGILKLLQDKSERVKFHASNALGKIGKRETIPAILDMVREAKDADPYLRHAGVMALVWINDFEAIVAAGKDPSPAVRMVSLLAMRRMERNEISMFLNDSDANVVLEAARAINDVPINGAMGELAALIEKPSYNDMLMKRVLNANFRVGNVETANALLRFAMSDGANPNYRADALNLLGDWSKPPLRDRITNLFRPIEAPREQGAAADVLRPVVNDLLKTSIERQVPE